MKREKKWWELEEEYETRYRTGRQSKNIWKYIPQKYWGCVTDAFSDSDGYWIFLDENHKCYDGRIIHEHTIAYLKDAIKSIRPGMLTK